MAASTEIKAGFPDWETLCCITGRAFQARLGADRLARERERVDDLAGSFADPIERAELRGNGKLGFCAGRVLQEKLGLEAGVVRALGPFVSDVVELVDGMWVKPQRVQVLGDHEFHGDWQGFAAIVFRSCENPEARGVRQRVFQHVVRAVGVGAERRDQDITEWYAHKIVHDFQKLFFAELARVW